MFYSGVLNRSSILQCARAPTAALLWTFPSGARGSLSFAWVSSPWVPVREAQIAAARVRFAVQPRLLRCAEMCSRSPEQLLFIFLLFFSFTIKKAGNVGCRWEISWHLPHLWHNSQTSNSEQQKHWDRACVCRNDRLCGVGCVSCCLSLLKMAVLP